MYTNMRASLCVQMLDNAMISYPMLREAILHFGSRQPAHESAVSGGNSNLWDSSKHETVPVAVVMITRVVRVCEHA